MGTCGLGSLGNSSDALWHAVTKRPLAAARMPKERRKKKRDEESENTKEDKTKIRARELVGRLRVEGKERVDGLTIIFVHLLITERRKDAITPDKNYKSGYITYFLMSCKCIISNE